ncbi:MAG: hypothetical protein PHW60_06215 [Kiritimatiellae bacterium]|nr:hypothetical protein [Kiritimatiellia bacterium]
MTHRQFRTCPDAMIGVGKKAVARFEYDWFILFPDDLLEWVDTGMVTADEKRIPPAVSQYLSAIENTLSV